MKQKVKSKTISVSNEMVNKLQNVVNIIADIVHVHTAVITKVDSPYIEVFRSSESEKNPFKVGDRVHLEGLYCEKVIETKERLLVPNALTDSRWKNNPDIKLGLISYLGFPILWPDGDVFGTLCILDTKENTFGGQLEGLMSQFKELIEAHLALLHRDLTLEIQAKDLQSKLQEIKTLKSPLPICSTCKKIRDDEGYWHQVDTYIQEHTDTHFSHSICPECTKKLYPEFYGDEEENGNS